MNEILYTPPYPILFGRISITKPKIIVAKKEEDKEEDHREEINDEFYEGFGIKFT